MNYPCDSRRVDEGRSQRADQLGLTWGGVERARTDRRPRLRRRPPRQFQRCVAHGGAAERVSTVALEANQPRPNWLANAFTGKDYK
jgi:hypothetical protein